MSTPLNDQSSGSIPSIDLSKQNLYNEDLKTREDNANNNTNRLYQLKWNEHNKIVCESAANMHMKRLFVDATLISGDYSFPVHKIVLSAMSPYFKEVFFRNNSQHPTIIFSDIKFKYLNLLLAYIYNGEIYCPQDDVNELLKIANSLQIKGLVPIGPKHENGVNYMPNRYGKQRSETLVNPFK